MCDSLGHGGVKVRGPGYVPGLSDPGRLGPGALELGAALVHVRRCPALCRLAKGPHYQRRGDEGCLSGTTAIVWQHSLLKGFQWEDPGIPPSPKTFVLERLPLSGSTPKMPGLDMSTSALGRQE